tara:strand:+ start:916 stop:1815 length:900 start_codon:yes stop_codon:yes gene_type:complete
MKNASYYFKVRNLIGDLDDPKFVSGALSNTAAEIINLISEDYWYLLAQEILTGQSDAVNNVTMVVDALDGDKKGFRFENDKIISVSVKGLDDDGSTARYRRAKRVDAKWIDHLRDSKSLLAPSAQEPVYVRKGKAIWIYGIDTPNSGTDFLRVQYVEYPSISYTDEYGIGVFPEELESALILGSAARVRLKEVAEIDDKITTSVSTTVGGSGLTLASTQLGYEDLEYAKAYLEEHSARINQMIAQAQTHSAETQRYAQKYTQLMGEIDRLSQAYFANLMPYTNAKMQRQMSGGEAAQAS